MQYVWLLCTLITIIQYINKKIDKLFYILKFLSFSKHHLKFRVFVGTSPAKHTDVPHPQFFYQVGTFRYWYKAKPAFGENLYPRQARIRFRERLHFYRLYPIFNRHLFNIKF